MPQSQFVVKERIGQKNTHRGSGFDAFVRKSAKAAAWPGRTRAGFRLAISLCRSHHVSHGMNDHLRAINLNIVTATVRDNEIFEATDQQVAAASALGWAPIP
jgi:hypothetical protein